jgi:hypothetical protein
MGTTKHRTQISLEAWQYQALLETSRKTKKSLSSIIRELVVEKFSKERMNIKNDPIMGIIGKGAGDGYPAAKKHDDILYRKGD